MKLSDKQKQWIAWLVIVTLATFLGVKFPTAPPFVFTQVDDEIIALGTTHFTNLEAEDITATDDLAVTDDATITDDLAVDGTATIDILAVTDDVTIADDLTVSGTASWGCSDTTISGDLTITGTATAQDVVITDTLDVDGATTLDDLDIDLSASLNIDGHMLDVGTGSCQVADSDNDVCIAAVLEVDGEIQADGLIDADAGMTIDGGVTNIGGGTPDIAAGDNDLYVTNDLEVDAELQLDGTVDVNAVVTGEDDLEHLFFPTVASTAFTYTASAGGTIPLFTVASGEIWLVHDVIINITTNFDCTGEDCVMLIGDDGDTDGYCIFADAEMQAADTEVTGIVAGWQCLGSTDVIGAYFANNRAMIYAPSGASEGITATLTASGNDFAAGAATAYVIYTRIQ